MIAVLGAGPHGRQVAHDLGPETLLYDDELDGFQPTWVGAVRYPWVAGTLWPKVRLRIVRYVESVKHLTDPHNEGIYIAPSAILGHDAQADRHVHILAGAIVSHGCKLDEFVTVATGARLCGEVHVERMAFIGAGAIVVHGGITIGEGAFVSAGAIVTKNVPAGHKVLAGEKW